MAGKFQKFQPKTQAPTAVKAKAPQLVLTLKETPEEKSAVLCFMREVTAKKNPSLKFFIGDVAARDEEGAIIRGENGYPESSGVIFFFFKDKKNPNLGVLKMKTPDSVDDKAEDVCALEFHADGKFGPYWSGKSDAGELYSLQPPKDYDKKK
jgi:hypothetical protein